MASRFELIAFFAVCKSSLVPQKTLTSIRSPLPHPRNTGFSRAERHDHLKLRLYSTFKHEIDKEYLFHVHIFCTIISLETDSCWSKNVPLERKVAIGQTL